MSPDSYRVTAILALGFFFNAAGVQHLVILQREMRFTSLAAIGVLSLLISSAIGIAGAKAGFGYWALVVMTVSLPLTSTIGFWLTADWVPGKPHKRVASVDDTVWGHSYAKRSHCLSRN